MRSIVFRTNVPATRKLEVQLPPDVPAGEADVAVIVESLGGSREDVALTLGDLIGSPLCGIWADRSDIHDSVEYARELRRRVEERDRGRT